MTFIPRIEDDWSTFSFPEYRTEDKYRRPFQRDRDRILYSSAFRRLAGKTQIFASGLHDHIRTRLTHTLEVAQIATTTAAFLGLNTNLTEAIALGHDLGHTPFGHVGEDVLKLIASGCDNLGGLIDKNWLPNNQKGFKHNLQSLRVVHWERRYIDHYGLNLSSFVRWGILNHSSTSWDKQCSKISFCPHNNNGSCKFDKAKDRFSLDFYKSLLKDIQPPMASLEAMVVAQADEIAQRHHDLEDSIHAKIIRVKEALEIIEPLARSRNKMNYFHRIKKNTDRGIILVNAMITQLLVGMLNESLIEGTKDSIKKFRKKNGLSKPQDFKDWLYGDDQKKISKEISGVVNYEEKLKGDGHIVDDLEMTLKNRILNSYLVERMDGKGRYILRQLWKDYLTNFQQLPDNIIMRLAHKMKGKITVFNEFDENITVDNREQVGKARDLLGKVKSKGDNKIVRKELIRLIIDWIAGMTDQMALVEHRRLYSAHQDVAELR